MSKMKVLSFFKEKHSQNFNYLKLSVLLLYVLLWNFVKTNFYMF